MVSSSRSDGEGQEGRKCDVTETIVTTVILLRSDSTAAAILFLCW